MRLKDLKKGDTVWECEMGRNIQVTALEDAQYVETPIIMDGDKIIQHYNEGYSCRVEACWEGQGEKEISNFFESVDCGPYGLKLYKTPQYINEIMTMERIASYG